MDPVSQGTLGAAVALSLFGRHKKLSPRVVGWLGALSAMAPDLDIFIRSAKDSLVAIEYHRHFTHSLAFVPVGAAIALAPWLLLQTVRINWKLGYAVSFLGYLTHAPLDCATTYGTQLFWPFTDYRVSLSWISVVDLVFSIPLLALTLAAGRKENPRWAWIGLLWGALYISIGALQKTRAEGVQQTLVQNRGHSASRRAVYGTFMNQIVFRSLYEHEGKIYVDQLRVPYLGKSCLTEGSSLTPLGANAPDAGPRVKQAHRLMHWFSSGWIARTPDDPSLLGDVRYSLTPYGTKPFWGVRTDLEKDTAEWVNTQNKAEMSASRFAKLIFQVPEGSICK